MSDLINKKYGSLILSYYGGDKEVLHIELNEPKKKNALTDELISEFCEVLRELRNSKEIRFLVLSGSGDIFSAGGDRKRMLERSGMFAGDARDLKHQYQEGIQQIPLCLESLNIPIIARVTGPAIGAGFDLMCMADFRYAIDSSFFAESFVQLGLVPGIGGTYFLTRLIGYNKAIELTLTGKRIDSSWALKNGVLNETFENVEKLDHGIKELLDGLKKNSSLAMGYAKQALKSAYHNQLKDNLEHLSTYQGICQSHPDHLKRIGK